MAESAGGPHPLMERIGAEEFPAWERAHRVISTFLMGPIMIVEAVTAVALLRRPSSMAPRALLWTGLALIVVVWLSTGFIQPPLHAALSRGFDAELPASLTGVERLGRDAGGRAARSLIQG